MDGASDQRRMGKGQGTLPEIREAEQGCKNLWNSLMNSL